MGDKPVTKGPHKSNSPVNPGDQVTSDGPLAGYWVCLSKHSTGNGNTPDGLKPGQSNDRWHWATASSGTGA